MAANFTKLVLDAIEDDVEFAQYIWGGETPQQVKELFDEWLDMSLSEGEEGSVAALLLKEASGQIDFKKVLSELEQYDFSEGDEEEEEEDEEE